MENENGTVSIKMEYGFPDTDHAMKAYGSLMTAVAMLRSFGNNTPRFRSNYSETFTAAELQYQDETGESAHDAAEDRKSTRLNSSHMSESRMPSSA